MQMKADFREEVDRLANLVTVLIDENNPEYPPNIAFEARSATESNPNPGITTHQLPYPRRAKTVTSGTEKVELNPTAETL
jgi:hypothetical protein